MTENTDTYRNTGPKEITRANDEDVAVGQQFTPSDAEIRAFGDRLELVEEAADEATSDDTAEEEATEADASGEVDPDEVLAEYVEDPTDYSQLSDLAEEVDGVPAAGLSTEDLRQRLAEELADE